VHKAVANLSKPSFEISTSNIPMTSVIPTVGDENKGNGEL
jgi:hypothetical protein